LSRNQREKAIEKHVEERDTCENSAKFAEDIRMCDFPWSDFEKTKNNVTRENGIPKPSPTLKCPL
jgi:hypothetical protein